MMSSVVAIVIKLKNESRVIAGACTSSREVLSGWLDLAGFDLLCFLLLGDCGDMVNHKNVLLMTCDVG